MQELSEQTGITRPAFYKRKAQYEQQISREEAVIAFVKRTRHCQNRIGMKKLYYMFKNDQP